jgi:peptidoglycan/LPS O-acetylase OafA/YrhL
MRRMPSAQATGAAAPAGDGSTSFRLGYRPPLDGIRGFALIAIMFFHTWLATSRGFPDNGTFISVDMFFALSGFLITTLLVQEFRRSDRIDLPAFYARRALRLFPALVAFLLIMLVLTQLDVFEGGGPSVLRGQILWTGLYVQNWHEVLSPSLSALSHAWTLSVEEQFDLIWPLVLWGLLALRRSPRVTITLVLLGALASAAVMTVLGETSGETNHFHALYGTDARAHGLLFGSALGIVAAFDLLPRPGKRWPLLVGWLGAAYFVAGFFVFHPGSEWNTRGVYQLAGLATTAMIFSVVYASGGVLARAFGSRLLVAAGRVSYGGYLWHLPVFYVLTEDRTGLSFWPLLVVRFVVTFSLATASFVLVERPALRFKRRFERRVDQTGSTVVVAPGVTMAE